MHTIRTIEDYTYNVSLYVQESEAETPTTAEEALEVASKAYSDATEHLIQVQRVRAAEKLLSDAPLSSDEFVEIRDILDEAEALQDTLQEWKYRNELD